MWQILLLFSFIQHILTIDYFSALHENRQKRGILDFVCPAFCGEGKIITKSEVELTVKPNGCGPKSYMNIDNFLRKKQLPKFVDCCNLHDLCYASCEPGHTRNICDHQFSQCLNEVCEEMEEEDQSKKIIRRCKKYAGRIYGAVDHLGCMFYLRRKEKSGCECRYINSTQLATKKCTGTIDCILRSFWSFGSKVVG